MDARKSVLTLLVFLMVALVGGIFFYYYQQGAFESSASSGQTKVSTTVSFLDSKTEKPLVSKKISIIRFSGTIGKTDYSEIEEVCSSCQTNGQGIISFQAIPGATYLVLPTTYVCQIISDKTNLPTPQGEILTIPKNQNSYSKSFNLTCGN
ncbi:MAG: hypothetical protein NTZ65_02830 [Candidatus Berkelbacteria bacterium]|nr:hypothetical protein [Candidatus Berkelbacteria bacterium]